MVGRANHPLPRWWGSVLQMKYTLLFLSFVLVFLTGCPSKETGKPKVEYPTPDYACPDEYRSTGTPDGICFTCPKGYEPRLVKHPPSFEIGMTICAQLFGDQVEGVICKTFCVPGKKWGTCDNSQEWKTMWCEDVD